eukprot:TRINITY_DN88578_c0_g1_i1.p1 TRINITY_DN88578_c0_g1~~TRINITY_DN88578_c0_g1_i1.p1  ORF type:complete len:725 (-),score=113.25 TRINITY_DN88578_c0_g1_i1:214-2388(-)
MARNMGAGSGPGPGPGVGGMPMMRPMMTAMPMQQQQNGNAPAQGEQQMPGGMGMPSGVQPGVRYMPCIVPMEQWQSMQNTGAVPIAQVQASQLASGSIPLNSLLGNMPAPGPGGPGGARMGGVPNGSQPGNNQPFFQQSNQNQSSRPTRGRSPRGRPTRGGSPSAGSRFGGGMPKPDFRFPQGDPQPTPADTSESMGNKRDDAWRPSFVDPAQAEKRRASIERRRSQSPPQQKRPAELEEPARRYSPERRSPERRSPERRSSPGPGRQSPRRNRSFGPFDRNIPVSNGYQPSDSWSQNLPVGGKAQVYLVADEATLSQAAGRLNFLEQGAIIALDAQGWNLKTAAGKLCLLQVAFSDPSGLQVFLFDVMQLGEKLYTLMPFFNNPHASKITADAQTHATVLAHKFGIDLMGVIDAQWAYETLNGRGMTSQMDVLDWCGVAPPYWKEEGLKLEQTSEVWGHRPLAKHVVAYAAQSVAMLHHASAVIWRRLAYAFGPTVFNMVANASRQRAEMAAAAGWACRNAGLWTAEQDYAKEDSAEKERELDSWLARRFGKKEGAPKPASIRAASAQRAASADRGPLPDRAFRQGDSPRTAAWRVVMAQMDPDRPEPSRQRSMSPTLETWLDRRGSVKQPKEGASRRASSTGNPSKGQERGRGGQKEEYSSAPLRPLGFDTLEHKRWTDIQDEEKAKEEDGEDGDEIFEDLKQMDRQRLKQAELSSKHRMRM